MAQVCMFVTMIRNLSQGNEKCALESGTLSSISKLHFAW
jgi:hypothetical protein